jgi:hypothetical protein
MPDWYYLFDSPRLGIVIAIIAETAILLGWAFARQYVRWRHLLVGPVLAGVFVLSDMAVETKREQLESVTYQLVKAVEDEDADGVISLFSDDMALSNGMDRATAERIVRQRLNKPIVEKNNIYQLEVTIADKTRGQVEFSVKTTFDPKSDYAVAPLILSSWRFDYAGDKDGKYRLKDIANVRLNNSEPIDVFRYKQ